VVAGSDAEGLPALVPDPDRRAPGRGAHVHPSTECWQLAVRRKAFPRALRVGGQLSGALVEEHLASTVSQTDTPQHRPEAGARSS
jgi:uncharacterized protein